MHISGFLKSTILAAMIMSVTDLSAQVTADNAMSRAVMNAYSQMLKENPRDYEAYFRRAGEYYRRNEYTHALADADKAIEYTPRADKDLRFQAYMLRAGIYEMGHRYALALDDINSALDLDPTAYQAICQRANIEFELGQYRNARQDYTRLQRYNPRSQEALFGLARVAVKENNIGMANEYMEQALALTPSNPDAYIQRATVKSLMNDNNGAASDLLQAWAIDSNSRKALSALVALADSDYPAVINALSNAIRQAPSVGMYYYMRATIAAAHFHYTEAIADFSYLIKENLYNYAGIYASLAECHYALCDFEAAQDNIDYALANYIDEGEHKNYYVIRSRIYRATGNFDKALQAVNRALDRDLQLTSALEEKALVLLNMNKAEEASSLLGEASMNAPDNPYLYMLRAWVMNDYLNQPTGAKNFYKRISDIGTDTDRIQSLTGFALLFEGKTAEANRWIERCLDRPDHDGLIHYYAACFYSWTTNTAKALQCMREALQAGYANRYNWTVNNDGRLNVSPLRDEPEFKAILQQYSEIFN